MFKDNLIELRKYHDLSQEELADKIGVSRQTLSKYETGESLPDIEKCKLIADVFGVTIDDLLNCPPGKIHGNISNKAKPNTKKSYDSSDDSYRQSSPQKTYKCFSHSQ